MTKLAFKFIIASIILLLGYGAVYALPSAYTAPASYVEASGENWLTGWTYRREFTSTATSTALVNYQIKLTLDSSHTSFFSNINDDGSDVRFTDEDGDTLIDHWEQSLNTSTPAATYWVEVPLIATSTTWTGYLYYGNVAATTTASSCDATFVWCETFDEVIQGDDPFGPVTVGNNLRYDNNPIITESGTGWRQNQVREMSNIVATGGVFYAYVAGVDASNAVDTGLFTSSAIAGPWLEDTDSPIMSGCEDSYLTMDWETGMIWLDPLGNMLILCERYTGATFEGDAEGYSCSAFDSCTSIGVVLSQGGTGEWDEDFSGASAAVVHYNNVLYFIFEGSTAVVGGQDDIGLATTTVASFTTTLPWTKFKITGSGNDSDPIINNGGVGTWYEDGIVSDDILYDGTLTTTLWVHGQPATEGAFSTGRFCTTDTPDSWDENSFTECGDVNPLDGSSQNQYIWGAAQEQYFHWASSIGSDYFLVDNLNTSKLRFERLSVIGSPADDDYDQQANYRVPINTVNGVLTIDTQQSGEVTHHSAGMYSVATPALDNFRLHAKMCRENSENSRAYTILGVGANGVDRDSTSNGPWEFLLNDSYAVQIQRELANQTFLVEKTSGIWNNLGTATLSAAHQNLCTNEYVLDYSNQRLHFGLYGLGADITVTGETTLSGTAKSVFVGAGSSSIGGADLQVDWLFLQNYRNFEASTSVGAEATEASGRSRLIVFWFWGIW